MVFGRFWNTHIGEKIHFKFQSSIFSININSLYLVILFINIILYSFHIRVPILLHCILQLCNNFKIIEHLSSNLIKKNGKCYFIMEKNKTKNYCWTKISCRTKYVFCWIYKSICLIKGTFLENENRKFLQSQTCGRQAPWHWSQRKRITVFQKKYFSFQNSLIDANRFFKLKKQNSISY